MKQILIVEDEGAIAHMLSLILAHDGYGVTVAVDGEQALARVASSPPDAIVLDHMMPNVDGPTFMRAFRTEETWQDIAIILLTADARASLKARDMGIEAVLRKPLRLDELVRTIEAAAA